jgi:hypothetical protein
MMKIEKCWPHLDKIRYGHYAIGVWYSATGWGKAWKSDNSGSRGGGLIWSDPYFKKLLTANPCVGHSPLLKHSPKRLNTLRCITDVQNPLKLNPHVGRTQCRLLSKHSTQKWQCSTYGLKQSTAPLVAQSTFNGAQPFVGQRFKRRVHALQDADHKLRQRPPLVWVR